ncbi:MAG: aminotransferase class I/II-fold pyridoxal phosphate-dependent enzyme [Anaerolineaceae bacterium]|nr:aminotransferase class I/II-fold pyridoxal phosphate-dependent enzyme [Anaerolineaceae bacterium]
MDVFEKCNQYTIAREAMEKGIYPYFIALDDSEGTEAWYHGKHLVMCGANNYLGLTTHPKVREAACAAVEKYGTSCSGSRFLNGTLALHEELEHELAEWVGKEAAIVFTTGMLTNLGTVSSLTGRGDYIILDKDDHASIVDGARLSMGGKIARYAHNDMKHLDQVLAGLPEKAGKLVVADGLFSMEGDLAPVPEMAEICKKYGARLMIDDAHGMGVMGNGHGTVAQFNATDDVDLIMATFSKAFASLGGFVAGDDNVIHYIKHTARALIFSASIPPANAAAALAALRVLKEEPDRPAWVLEKAEYMRRNLREMGFDIGNSVTPVVPIIIGDDEKTFLFWKMLFEAGVFVNPVISPAVPQGRQLLRTSYMATHTTEQLDFVLEQYQAVGKALGVIE